MANEIIRPVDLPDRPNPVASEKMVVDNGSTVAGATITSIVDAGRPLASQLEAETGTNASKAMTPLTTAQAITKRLADVRFATPALYGAIGDGVTDDTDALVRMFQDQSFNEFDGLSKTYAIRETVEISRGDLKVQNLFVTGRIANSTASLKFAGTQGVPVPLTSGSNFGQTVIPVADASAFSVNQWALFQSSALLWTSIPFAEMAKVKSRDVVANTITLYDGLALYYNVGDSATATPLNTLNNIVIEDCGVYGDVLTTGQIGFQMEYCADVEFRRPRTFDCHYVHINLSTCADVNVFGGIMERTGALNGLNYFIVAGRATNGLNVQGVTFRTGRHGVATGGSLGVIRHVRACNNFAYDMYDAGFDAHPQTIEVDYSHNTVEMADGAGASADGIISQGLRFTAIGNKINNVKRHGVYFQPFISVAGLVAEAIITDNELKGGPIRATGYGVACVTTGAVTIRSAVVEGNSVEGFTNGIYAGAINADFDAIAYNGNTVDDVSFRPMYLQATAGQEIKSGSVSNNVLKSPSTISGTECLMMNGADAASIIGLSANGNSMTNGIYGIRGVNTDRIAATGNTSTGATTPYTIAGAASVLMGNVPSP